MNEPTEGLQVYQSIKRVLAGEIVSVVEVGCYVREADGTMVLREFAENMTARYKPVPGDFWVVYPGDGFQSLSPRHAFESGYVVADGETDLGWIAKACHEVNRAYCASIGDHTQPPWERAPDWQKESAIAGVRFAIDHPDARPEDSHNSWMAQKRADGWIFGPFKNVEAKEHPAFMPYNELSREQRAKDALFLATVRALI